MPVVSRDFFAVPRGTNRARTYSTSGVLLSDSTTVDVYSSRNIDWMYKYWERTPNYRSLVRARAVLPTQPFDYRKEVAQRGGFVRREINTFYGTGQLFGRYEKSIPSEELSYAGEAPVDSGPLFSRLKTKLLEQQQGDQWNAPVFLAEASKTSRMVTDRAWHLVSLVRALRRGDANRFLDGLRTTVEGASRRRAVQSYNRLYGRDASRAAANMWLEYTYGWRPFMQDVHDATMTLMTIAEEPSSRVGVTRASVRDVVPVGSLQAWDQYLSFDSRESRAQVSYKGTWLWELKPESIPGRLGLLNPLEVAWELLPFSFVVDWFLPIGDYLSQLDTSLSVTHKGGTYGYRAWYDYVVKPVATPPAGTRVFVSGEVRSTRLRVLRSAMTERPALGIDDIRLNPKLGTTRLTSALSLLRQNLGRLRRD